MILAKINSCFENHLVTEQEYKKMLMWLQNDIVPSWFTKSEWEQYNNTDDVLSQERNR